MLRALLVAVVGVIPSLALILWIERGAERVTGAPLARWRRLLIPVPIILFLLSRSDGVLLALVPSPSRAFLERVHWISWSSVQLSFLLVALLPFILANSFRQGFRLLLEVWGGHVFWMFFPFAPWLIMITPY